MKALKSLSSQINIEGFYILSDDFDVLKEINENLSKHNVITVEGQSVLEDMNIFRQFSNYILENSTLWWEQMLSHQ